MHTEHAHLRMSETTILCKTQDAASTQHRLVARSGAQAKLHQASHNQAGRLYPAFIVPIGTFLYSLAIDRRSLMRPKVDVEFGNCPPQYINMKSLAMHRPAEMSSSDNMYNIVMRDDRSKVLKTLLC